MELIKIENCGVKHSTLSLSVVLQTGIPISVYLTKVWGEWGYCTDLSSEVTCFPNY